MDLKGKILSKSNSYNFYKKNYEASLNEIKLLIEERDSFKNSLEDTSNKLKYMESKAKMTLKERYDEEYARFSYFCAMDYVDFYYDEDFEDNFKEVTKHLDSKEKHYYKYLFLRNLFVNFIRQDSFYADEELELQEEFREFERNNVDGEHVGEFKFTGDYNLHPFIGFSLEEGSLDFLKDKDIIDAGAFTGDTSLPLSKLTSSNVYAFEPFGESFELLRKNIADNGIKNIVPVKKSLGNINGERSLYLSGTNFQGITCDENIRAYDEVLKVQETTIDTFVEENDLDVGFIIVDVEGAELDLLEGARNTIMTQKPILTISIYHRLKDFTEIIPWIADLDLGYEFKIINEGPWSFMVDRSVLCVPK